MVMNFKEELIAFENEVILSCVSKGLLVKKSFVSVRNGKLFSSMSPLFGYEIKSALEFAVDYYGYVKKSTGLLITIMDLMSEPGVQVSAVSTCVIHFASIKIELIMDVAPSMVQVFPVLKREILIKRGFLQSIAAKKR